MDSLLCLSVCLSDSSHLASLAGSVRTFCRDFYCSVTEHTKIQSNLLKLFYSMKFKSAAADVEQGFAGLAGVLRTHRKELKKVA